MTDWVLGQCPAEQVGSDPGSYGPGVAGGLEAPRRQGSVSPQLSPPPTLRMLTSASHPPVLDCSPILSSFQVILLEHIIMCRLVTGHKATALQEVRPLGAAHTQGGKAEG